MLDFCIGSSIYLSAFFITIILGVYTWSIIRSFYKNKLYQSSLKFPNIYDLSLLIIFIYISHLIIDLLQGY